MSIKTVPQPPYSPDLAPCDFVNYKNISIFYPFLHASTATRNYSNSLFAFKAHIIHSSEEQTEYAQNQINEIRYLAEDRQSRIAWKTVNEMSKKKSSAKAKLKATSQEERINLDEIPPEKWKTREFDNILLRLCNAGYNQNTKDRGTKGCIFLFPKKCDLGIANKYWGITLTSIAAKIYNSLLRNRIEPKVKKILRKNQNGFRRIRSTISQILTIYRILEVLHSHVPYHNDTIIKQTQAW